MKFTNALLPFSFLLYTPTVFAQGEICSAAQSVVPGTYSADGPAAGGGATQSDAQNADWYVFTSDVDAYMTVFSCGSQIDTRVFVHTGDCGALTLLGNDDDGCPEGYPPGSSLLANIPITSGTTYFIEWDDRYSAAGFEWQLLVHDCPIADPAVTAGIETLSVDWPVLVSGATFILEYGPAGFTQGTGIVITGVQGDVQPPVELTGLEGNTEYDMYISITCNGGSTAPFTGPWHGITEGAGPANDLCESPVTITCGSTTLGSTLGAQDDVAPGCGTGVTAPGVWYSFSGVEGTVVLSTCADFDYDTRINVYTGDCDALECVAGNDDGPFGCGFGSEVIFTATATSTYSVLVQGYNGDVGAFGLFMDCPSCAPPTGIFATTADAQAFLYWTPGNAGASFTVEYGLAGFAPGTGTLVTGQIGIDGPPVTLPGLDPATDYDVYLTEDCGGGDLSYTRGPVGFTTLTDPVALNAFCEGALPIACGQDVTGNTTESIFIPGLTCGSAYTEAPGLWYTFTGDGNDITLTTCDQASFDTKISVYSGSCAEPICVAGNDDSQGCGTTSTLSFSSEPGIVYRAIVHGYDGETGTYTLSMTCAEPCTPSVLNDDCVNAELLVPQLTGSCVPLSGSNVCAYGSPWPNPPCDPFGVVVDVWYALPTGPSSSHTITIASLSSGDLGVAVYTACDPASFTECYDPQLGPIQLSGLQTDATYYIRVWNSGGAQAGSFTICDEADLISSIGEQSALALRAWPVPVDGVLNVDGLSEGSESMRLLDVQGRTIMQQRVERNGLQTLNTSGIAAGSYVLHVDGLSTQIVRIVIR
ncbi:MAG: T9SS type A sorting domain-containing protein [Flavobacteriales bacterium]|nr:T9SS type A sorting domain-containing protein [Flavobacteriales bacterium]